MQDHNLVTVTTDSTTCPMQVSELSTQEPGLLSSFCNSLRTGITEVFPTQEEETNKNLPFTDP